MQWLKHAFAVDPEGAAEPDEAQRSAAEAVCRQVVRRHLTTPALICLESLRPLNYLIAQGMHATMPLVSVLTGADGPRRFATFLEHRGSFDYLCRRIEELEAEAVAKESQEGSDLIPSEPTDGK
jgi:hypothetical protein